MSGCDEDAHESALLVSMLGHDLRNALTSILSGLKLLSRRRPREEPERVLVDRLHDSAWRMSSIIDQLLDFERSRLSGRIPLLRQEFDLGELCADIIAELEASSGIEVRFDELGDTTGEWDRDCLARMISNLVGNAVVHGDPNSAAIIVDGRGGDVVIACHNAGPPIAAELFSKLFNPFARSARSAGLGLGLYIVSRVVKEHGGNIKVTSTIDHGTTFTIRLPRGSHLEDRR